MGRCRGGGAFDGIGEEEAERPVYGESEPDLTVFVVEKTGSAGDGGLSDGLVEFLF